MSKPKRINNSVEKTSRKSPFGDSEFELLLKEYLDQCTFDNDKEEKETIALLKELVVGGMYYMGSNGYLEAYIIDGLVKKKNKNYKRYHQLPFTFELQVRQWNFGKEEFGPRRGYAEGYQYFYNLDKFLEEVHVPRLSSSPKELIAEAEEIFKTGDFTKYTPNQADQGDNDGPGSQLMHTGSKEALVSVEKTLAARRAHAEAMERSLEIVIQSKLQEIEAIKDKFAGVVKAFEKQLTKIRRVITTIELFLGISEEIVQILEGPAAPESDPLCIRQTIHYMDEEFGDVWDDGRGIEWKDLSAFGDWLARNGNYKRVIPESKCIVAFKCRREPKERSENPFWDALLSESDDYTFLLMRNGDNLYRIITDKIDFTPRLFPRRKEMQQLHDLWNDADLAEHRYQEWVKNNPNGGHYSNVSLDWAFDKDGINRNSKKRDKRYSDVDPEWKDNTEDVKEFTENQVFFYKMRFTLFQGLLERTTIFQPMPPGTSFLNSASVESGRIRLIYDDELKLPSHRKQFWDWLEEINSKISFGSRIVLTHNKAFQDEFFYSKYRDEHHSDRLDERFGEGKKSSKLPPLPVDGLYYVKQSEFNDTEPVWIDNPSYDPDLLTTPDVAGYSPKEDKSLKPKNPKGYYNSGMLSDSPHVCRNPKIRMTYAQQKEYFGKIVEKGMHADYEEKHVTGIWLHGVFNNPKRIQKTTKEPVYAWRAGNWTATKKTRDKYLTHRVATKFMCIRYNPGDKVSALWMSAMEEPTERKNNLSWKINTEDKFIINFDLITLDDVDFYLNSRIDRIHYLAMMPLLNQIRQQLEKEQKSEKDFKKLVAGEVLKASGKMVSKEDIDAAVESWKKDLKWKRAIHHDDAKALRMIVKRLNK